jgi:hypothetical protein
MEIDAGEANWFPFKRSAAADFALCSGKMRFTALFFVFFQRALEYERYSDKYTQSILYEMFLELLRPH